MRINLKFTLPAFLLLLVAVIGCRKDDPFYEVRTLKAEDLTGGSEKKYAVKIATFSEFERHPDSINYVRVKSDLLFGHDLDTVNTFITFKRAKTYSISQLFFDTIKNKIPVTQTGEFFVEHVIDQDVIGLNGRKFYVVGHFEKNESKDLKETLVVFCIVPDALTPSTKYRRYSLWLEVD